MSTQRRIQDTTPQALHDFFTSRGWSSANAWGIAGNVKQESGFASNAANYGKGETSYGLNQWNSKGSPERWANFKRIFGKPITESNAIEQMQFVDWELKNSEKKAGDALRKQTTPYSSAMVFGKLFERPNVVETVRGKNAEEFARGEKLGTSKVSTIPASIDSIFESPNSTDITPEEETFLESITPDLPDFEDIGLRIGFGVLGMVILGFGLFALGNQTVNTVTSIAKKQISKGLIK